MYLDIPAELPGVILEDDIGSEQVVMDEPEPDFVEQATAVLNNVGIDPQDRLQLLQEQHKAGHGPIGPAPAKNNQDEIVYEITFDLPDTGLTGNNAVKHNDDKNTSHATEDIFAVTCRSVIGNEPYNRYSPRTTFLQLREVRAHRSVLKESKYVGLTKKERMHVTTWISAQAVDDVTHSVDTELLTKSEDKLKAWAYKMTQYNLKPGLRKFGGQHERQW
jgi:hypothetical protein